MKNIFTHSTALLVGLIAGYFLFNIDTQHAIESVNNRNAMASTLSRLGDINKLKKMRVKPKDEGQTLIID